MVSDVAIEHAAQGAHTLRRAILIEDPYIRADAVWEAALRARSAAEHLRGAVAARCAEIVGRLEEGCEAEGRALPAEALRACADSLDAIPNHPSAGHVRAATPIEPFGSIDLSSE